MRNDRIITAARAGKRVWTRSSLHKKPINGLCPYEMWRVVYCNNDEDVVECCGCGRQKVTSCNFDEEYA